MNGPFQHPCVRCLLYRYRRVDCMYRGYREGEFLLATANEIIRDRIIMRHRSELFYRYWNYSNQLSTTVP